MPFPDDLLDLNNNMGNLNFKDVQNKAKLIMREFIKSQFKNNDGWWDHGTNNPKKFLTVTGKTELEKIFKIYHQKLKELDFKNLNKDGFDVAGFFEIDYIRALLYAQTITETIDHKSFEQQTVQTTDLKERVAEDTKDEVEADKLRLFAIKSSKDKVARLLAGGKVSAASPINFLLQSPIFDRKSLIILTLLLGRDYSVPQLEIDEKAVNLEIMPLIVRLEILLDIATTFQKQLERKQDDELKMTRMQVFFIENWQENFQKARESNVPIYELKQVGTVTENEKFFKDLSRDLEVGTQSSFDQFNFGIIAFEFLSGINLNTVVASDKLRIISRLKPCQTACDLKWTQFNTTFDQSIGDLVARCWSHDSDDRPSMQEICGFLKKELNLLKQEQLNQQTARKL